MIKFAKQKNKIKKYLEKDQHQYFKNIFRLITTENVSCTVLDDLEMVSICIV